MMPKGTGERASKAASERREPEAVERRYGTGIYG